MNLEGNYCSKILSEWYDIAYPIINNPEFQRRKNFRHHGKVSVYDHVIKVSIHAFMMAKSKGLDYKSACIAGLLHDFYETPWEEDLEHKPLLKRHAFTHAENALMNAKKFFPEYMNPVVENSILRHMFPLNIRVPKYIEGWIITIADKRVSMECFFEKDFFYKTFLALIGR